MILIEVFAAISTFICVVLAWTEKPLSFVVGSIAVILYGVVFLQSGLFANVFLQVVYLGLSVKGYFEWLAGSSGTKSEIRSFIIDISLSGTGRYIKAAQVSIITLVTIFLSVIVGYFGNLSVPDIFTTMLSLTATWFMIYKYIESWILWVIVDLAYVGLFWKLEMTASTFLYIILTIMALGGFRLWQLSLKKD